MKSSSARRSFSMFGSFMCVLYQRRGGSQATSEIKGDFFRGRTLGPASHKPRKDQGERGSDQVGEKFSQGSCLRMRCQERAERRRKPKPQKKATSVRWVFQVIGSIPSSCRGVRSSPERSTRWRC